MTAQPPRPALPAPPRARGLVATLAVGLAAALVLAGPGPARAQGTEPESAPDAAPATPAPEEAVRVGPSGRPLPRFAALGSDHINMRTGPGTRYPVTWVYKRRGLPVEVTRETEDWREVRDPDGAEGWMHKAMLSHSNRMALVTGETRQILLRRPEPAAEGVAEVEPGVIVKLLQCPRDGRHCRVEAGRFQGWLLRAALWGVHPTDYVD
ncbi:SH3 domain-containing protein [Roseospira goensis]|uniref:SH3-like domain-containing protein n=1 Tax=Roseospira goensis TaxID=391922 RepID=A0A7W6S210_9PROT|nr:SH3 domain-containing protein [Roseospira goensis]MBB4286945.1 SH3-like domain-containing protein [Roseospira goensis]